MNIKQPQSIEPLGRIPASGRHGRGWGLPIAEWGFEIRDTIHEIRIHRVATAPNKPNPGRGGLAIDDRLWIIDDLG
jgi:hypothetical protein